jgi:hypothetical protein
MNTTYPVILYPLSIQKALASLPPLPEQPKILPEPILQTLPKPEEPEVFIELLPKKLQIITLFLSELGVSIISAFISSVSNNIGAGGIFFIMLTLGVVWFGYNQVESYPIRLSQYREKLTAYQEKQNSYSKIIEKWEQSRHQDKIKHKKLLAEWEHQKQKLEKIYQQEIEILQTPQKVNDWKMKACQQAFLSLNPQKFNIESAEDKRGFAEYPHNSQFPKLLIKYFNDDKIFILKMVVDYTPDFAYVDHENNRISIDIEIDEPYTPRQYPNNSPLKTTHCIGQDDNRNYFFQERDWYVIRFSERQILIHPESCCKVIAQQICKFTGDDALLREFDNIPDLQPEPLWTKNDAINKANRRERLNYRVGRIAQSMLERNKDNRNFSQIRSKEPPITANMLMSEMINEGSLTLNDRKSLLILRQKMKNETLKRAKREENKSKGDGANINS